jgi:hypothetical protein
MYCGQKNPAFWSFLVFVAAHMVLGIMSLTGDPCAVKNLPAAIETEARLRDVLRELERRNVSLRMVRGAIDSFNHSTCNLTNWCKDGFEEGLKPIIDHFTADIGTALGVTSSRFTLEVYTYDDAVYGLMGSQKRMKNFLILGNHGGELSYFFSSQQASKEAALTLADSNQSPAILGTTENVPAVHSIHDHPGLYMKDGQPLPSIYFRRYATVPFNWACSDQRQGLIVLTSMQEEEFSEDVLDVLGFLGSLISKYISSYNRCAYDQKKGSRETRQETEAGRGQEAKAVRPGSGGQARGYFRRR